MTGGEIDRRIAERERADRRYNDALTAVDAALPALPDMSAAAVTPAVGCDLREHAALGSPAPAFPGGWRGRLAGFVWRIVAPVFGRQEAFNLAVADALTQTAQALRDSTMVLQQGRVADRRELQSFLTFHSQLVQFLQQITPFVDTKVRVLEQRLDEVRMAATAARRAAAAARRDPGGTAAADTPAAAAAPATQPDGSAAAAYVGFEDLFRGTSGEIRARQQEYADWFAGASDVLDVGCGRGEFLDLLRERGIIARGVDGNAEMAAVCQARGLDVRYGDALAYLEGLPDASVGGLMAAQVVEHLAPDYLVRLIETAHARLRPGARIVLETINVACWVAFFESYIRDITHVRPLHPDTLKFLVVAAGFEQVDVHYRSPIADEGRLQRVGESGLTGTAAELARAMNANTERLNLRLFTYLDYAVSGVKAR